MFGGCDFIRNNIVSSEQRENCVCGHFRCCTVAADWIVNDDERHFKIDKIR